MPKTSCDDRLQFFSILSDKEACETVRNVLSVHIALLCHPNFT